MSRVEEKREPMCSSELKLCGVCGDVAKSHHFGGLSCNSCKAFFRRSVQNDHYFKFECVSGSGQCLVTKETRKSCQYCRMRQCFAIGMDKRWVMTDEQKRALLSVRSAKKNSCDQAQLAHQQCEGYKPLVDKMTDFMTPREIKDIECIVSKYVHAYTQVPYRAELRNFDNNKPGSQAMEMFATLVRRFVFYFRMMPDFTGLPNEDQTILLKGGMLEMCLLRGALAFDPLNNRWPNTDMAVYKDAPVINLSDVTRMASSPVFQMHMDFIRFIKQLGADEPTIMLLVLVVLFTDRPGVTSAGAVEHCQIHYTSLLKRYMNWRFGLITSQKLFNKLLTKLSDLRELSESHNQKNLHFENEEISLIQNELQYLAINPYPDFNILNDGNEPGDICEAQPKSSHGYQASALERDKFMSREHTSNYAYPETYDSTSSTSESATNFSIPQESANSHVSFEDGVHQRYSYVTESPESSNSSYLSDQRNAYVSRNTQENVPIIQFMNTINQTVNQALDEPPIGAEWTESDFMLDCYASQELIEALACLPEYCPTQAFPPDSALEGGNSGRQTGSRQTTNIKNSSQSLEINPGSVNSEVLLEEFCRELETFAGSCLK